MKLWKSKSDLQFMIYEICASSGCVLNLMLLSFLCTFLIYMHCFKQAIANEQIIFIKLEEWASIGTK